MESESKTTMIFGKKARAAAKMARNFGLGLALLMGGQAAMAAEAAYVPMTPTPGKGMPVDKGIGLQDQYSQLGEYGFWIHNSVLLPIIAVIFMSFPFA